MTNCIYADNAATTAVSDMAFNAMLPYLKESYGNPSAIHSFGTNSKRAVEEARRTVAESIGARINEIYFTSGGTESDNWALMGAVESRKKKGKHVIITEIEHNAVFRTAQQLEQNGYSVTYLPVDQYGMVSPEKLKDALRDDTILVSIMMANNEIGTIQPIRELCSIAKKRGILFHTDAVQAVGHIPINVSELGVDMLSLSAHKFHGPKGVGALYINIGTVLPPIIFGGGQEKGKRSGTTNVSGVVGMATALREATENMEEHTAYVTNLRDQLIKGILKLHGTALTGHPTERLPGIASFLFEDTVGSPLVTALNEAGVAASSGSACSAGSGEPSRVLKAMGLIKKEQSVAPLRLSLSAYNTQADIDAIINCMPIAISRAKAEREIPEDIDLDGE